MTTNLETADMLVVTVRVPARTAADLSLTLDGGVIRVAGPDGFAREVALPRGADPARLHAGLFHSILELRAPRAVGTATPVTRVVPVADPT